MCDLMRRGRRNCGGGGFRYRQRAAGNECKKVGGQEARRRRRMKAKKIERGSGAATRGRGRGPPGGRKRDAYSANKRGVDTSWVSTPSRCCKRDCSPRGNGTGRSCLGAGAGADAGAWSGAGLQLVCACLSAEVLVARGQWAVHLAHEIKVWQLHLAPLNPRSCRRNHGQVLALQVPVIHPCGSTRL